MLSCSCGGVLRSPSHVLLLCPCHGVADSPESGGCKGAVVTNSASCSYSMRNGMQAALWESAEAAGQAWDCCNSGLGLGPGKQSSGAVTVGCGANTCAGAPLGRAQRAWWPWRLRRLLHTAFENCVQRAKCAETRWVRSSMQELLCRCLMRWGCGK